MILVLINIVLFHFGPFKFFCLGSNLINSKFLDFSLWRNIWHNINMTCGLIS